MKLEARLEVDFTLLENYLVCALIVLINLSVQMIRFHDMMEKMPMARMLLYIIHCVNCELLLTLIQK